MNLLIKQTLGEFKKSFTRKEGKLNAKVGVAIAIILSIGVFVLLGLLSQITSIGGYTERTLTKDECVEMIAVMEVEMKNAQENAEYAQYSWERNERLLYAENCKKTIAVLRYVIDHDLNGAKYTVDIPNSPQSLGRRSWAYENLTTNEILLTITNTVLLLYAVLVVCSVFGDDYKKKTIRMLALRPMTRNRILIVKTLAVMAHLFLATLAVYLLQIFLTALSVGLDYTTVVMAMGRGAAAVHPVLYLPWILFNQYLTVLFFMSLSIMLCVVLKSKLVPIIVVILLIQAAQVLTPLVSYAGGINLYLATFIPHTNLNQYFGHVPFAGMGYLLSLFALLLYAGVFTFVTYFTFNRRDIA